MREEKSGEKIGVFHRLVRNKSGGAQEFSL
jgi:hypothetical protein